MSLFFEDDMISFSGEGRKSQFDWQWPPSFGGNFLGILNRLTGTDYAPEGSLMKCS